jgi:hypothetical protein
LEVLISNTTIDVTTAEINKLFCEVIALTMMKRP